MSIPKVAQLAIMAFVVSALIGCSTIRPYKSGRAGFFDRNRSLAGRSSTDSAQPTPKAIATARAVEATELSRADFTGLRFQWPIDQVSVTSPFGSRGSDFHEGIDLRARSGTPIHAVEAGTVLYADKRVSGYGKMVVIRHANGFASVYAHNSRLLVRRGQVIRKGQKIALSGNTGRSSGPHVHFEVRKGVTPLDPTKVIQLGTMYAAADRAAKSRKMAQLAAPAPRPGVSTREAPRKISRKVAFSKTQAATRIR